MRRLLMLDSGAFSVWNSGSSVDLDAYIEFCKSHPCVDYYVNLDVIPGQPGQKSKGTKTKSYSTRNGIIPYELLDADAEKACVQGWENYKKMVSHLPMDKVIPVVHQKDSPKWIKKYVDFGAPYLGLAPVNDRAAAYSEGSKASWFKEIKPYIFDSQGNRRINIHGFAVTSFTLMKYWYWHSVDSASWKLQAAWGGIYVPKCRKGVYDYSCDPCVLNVSPMSRNKSDYGKHLCNLKGSRKSMVFEYLESIGAAVGKSRIIKVDNSHKLVKDEQLWYNKKQLEVLHIEEPGITNSFGLRAVVNANFMKRVNKSLTIDHIYLAGSIIPFKPAEKCISKRLLSFHDSGIDRAVRKRLNLDCG